MSIKGGPYAHFRHALRLGSLTMIRAAAAELPHIDLGDALAICLIMSAQNDERYDRAATRWLARLVCERPAVGLEDLRTALTALETLPQDPDVGKSVLRSICHTYRLEHVVGLLD